MSDLMVVSTDDVETLADKVLAAMRKHPLPWRIDRDWTWEVIASDGHTVAKCMRPEQARAVVAQAEQIAASGIER